MSNANWPAHPLGEATHDPCRVDWNMAGLTKREMFAMTALQGMLAGPFAECDETLDALPHDAVKFADALLKELNR